MNAKKRKNLKIQLNALTKAQLIALAVQKEVLPYLIALGQTKESLVETLLPVEGVLKPQEA
jgi:hypothetical protein